MSEVDTTGEGRKRAAGCSDPAPVAPSDDRTLALNAQMQRAANQVEQALRLAAKLRPDHWAREWLVSVPPYDADGVVIERFEVTGEQARIDKLRAAFNPQRSDRSLDPGTYTRLTVDGAIWMTDTPAEVRDHQLVDQAMAVYAGGSALIAGLGLGLVLNRAITVHRMSVIDVVEIDRRVIDAVGPHCEALAAKHGTRLTIHEADIHQWKPRRGTSWGVGWFDIWATISDDDMPEVTRLRGRFWRRLGWFGAWGQAERVAMARRIRSGEWAY